jgi:hypothetical protein
MAFRVTVSYPIIGEQPSGQALDELGVRLHVAAPDADAIRLAVNTADAIVGDASIRASAAAPSSARARNDLSCSAAFVASPHDA